jgi:hypothetical protein
VTVVSFWVGVWMVIRLGYTEGGLQLQRWWVDNGATQPARHAIGITRDIETNFWSTGCGSAWAGCSLTAS